MNFVRRVKIPCVAATLLLSLAGLCLLIWPRISALTACRLLGGLAVFLGAARLLGYFSRDLYRLAFQFDLAGGIFLLLVGAALLLRPQSAYRALPICAGFFILMDSLLKLQTALDARRFGVRGWWIILVCGLLAGALGTLLFLRPFQSADAMARLLGITLLVSGLHNLYIVLTTVRTSPGPHPGYRDDPF
jgi:uncharacterized membrane protein HdeD (DUF308 family)